MHVVYSLVLFNYRDQWDYGDFVEDDQRGKGKEKATITGDSSDDDDLPVCFDLSRSCAHDVITIDDGSKVIIWMLPSVVIECVCIPCW